MQIEGSNNREKFLPEILLRDDDTHPQSAHPIAKSLCKRPPHPPLQRFRQAVDPLIYDFLFGGSPLADIS